MDNIKNKIRIFSKERDWSQFHSPENLAKSISIEAGELLECFQWDSDYNREEVSNEIADIVNYCILLCDAISVDLEDVLLAKLKQNEMKYPVAKAKGNSKKYNKF